MYKSNKMSLWVISLNENFFAFGTALNEVNLVENYHVLLNMGGFLFSS